MFGFLFGNRNKSPVPQEMYGKIVEQARKPCFFTQYGFADSVMGRFDCLSLHVFMVSYRLANSGDTVLNALNQEVYDCFVGELETAMREIGIGDTSVPKKKKKMVRSFYAMIAELQDPIQKGEWQEVERNLGSRFFGAAGVDAPTAPDQPAPETPEQEKAEQLAAYVRECTAALDNISAADLRKALLVWPDPEGCLK